jgi:PAS domain S-box-containing protein
MGITEVKPEILKSSRQWLVVLTVFGIGISLSLGAFRAVETWEKNKVESRFARISAERTTLLRQHLEEHERLLDSMAALYALSPPDRIEGFRRFAAPLLEDHDDVVAVAWVPALAAGDLESFERKTGERGLSHFQVTQIDSAGRRVRPVPGGMHYPIAYVEPLVGNEPLVGLDLGTAEAWRRALEFARDTGRDAAIGDYGQEGCPLNGTHVSSLRPVYSNGPWSQSLEDRRRDLAGFLMLIRGVAKTYAEKSSQSDSYGVRLSLVAALRPEGKRLIFNPGDSYPDGIEDLLGYNPAADLAAADTFSSAGIDWMVTCVPAPGLVGLTELAIPWACLLCGLALTGLLGAYTAASIRRSAKVRIYAEKINRINSKLKEAVASHARAERALQDSEEYLKAILDTVGTGILVIDPEGHTIVDANRAAAELIGVEKEDMIGKVCHKYICPAEVGRCPITDLGQKVDRSERTVLKADGSEIPCLKTVIPIQLRGREHLLDCFIDISDQKRAEGALRHESAKLSAMISGMEEGVVFADETGAIVEVNEFFCEFVDRSREEILGTTMDDWHEGEVLDHLKRLVETFKSGKDSEPFILQRRLGEAEVILRMQPIYRDGEYDGVLLNVIDVTELVEARHRAEDATRAKSDFLANMSHEIRTPMTAILGYTDLLAEEGVDQDSRREYLATIKRNGAHLLSLINDILDLSKIEADRMTVNPERAPVHVMVEDVAGMMRVRAEDQATEILTEFPTPVPETIETDPEKLRRALVNLVSNAVKFTERGRVRIVTSFLESWKDGAPAVRMQVIDNGIGISEEKMARLFQPFVQADTSTSRRYGGTGLGLTITRRIAEMLGGEITADSSEGMGSTFTLTVPTGGLEEVPMLQDPARVLAEREEDLPPAGEPSVSLEGFSVLLAEDGVDNQRLIRTVLIRSGATVSVAEDGLAAIKKAEIARYDVILMDLQMPHMDGFEATRKLRERGYTAPILALTAHAMSQHRERALEAGFDDHLAKPIERDVLLSKVAEWAGGEAQPEPAEEAAEAVGAPEAPQAPGPGAETKCVPESIESEYSDDPGLAPLIAEFAGDLPDRLEALEQALESSDLQQVEGLAHQLKGAGGSYGFPRLSEVAAALEEAARTGDEAKAEGPLREIGEVIAAIAAGHGDGARKPDPAGVGSRT